VDTTIGNDEVESSILSSSTIFQLGKNLCPTGSALTWVGAWVWREWWLRVGLR